jgi:hypothetical protein
MSRSRAHVESVAASWTAPSLRSTMLSASASAVFGRGNAMSSPMTATFQRHARPAAP